MHSLPIVLCRQNQVQKKIRGVSVTPLAACVDQVIIHWHLKYVSFTLASKSNPLDYAAKVLANTDMLKQSGKTVDLPKPGRKFN